MSIKFDTNVQELKYRVLKAIAKSCYEGTLLEDYNDIPKEISPGPKSKLRCCIYKERAIVLERMKLALGGNKEIDNVVEVIKIACDECPSSGHEVTTNCKGCIAHRCQIACPKDAIRFDSDTHTAIIDKEKCVNCGRCASVCQYNAIVNYKRPCQIACKVNAIDSDENKAATIDNDKCVQCGACVYQCPFGAIMDKSSITEVIREIKESDFSNKYPIYAVVAPSISAQCDYYTLNQLVTAIEKLGFRSVIEAALGADMVSYDETKELIEKGKLTSSCCPTFVSYIEKYNPKLKEYISSSLSPAATIGKWIKQNHPDSKIVFIGPCISKKMEIKKENVKDYVDYVLTFEELQALIDSRDIQIEELDESPLDNASYYGRIFARSGGISEAIAQAIKEQGSDINYNPLVCDGLDNCKIGLARFAANNSEYNFIEGMGCVGGCIGGPCCLTHEPKDKKNVDAYGNLAKEKTISDAISIFKNI